MTLNDKIAQEIISQEHTLDSLLDIHRQNLPQLNTLHNVLLFNKLTNLFTKEDLSKDPLTFGRVSKTINNLQDHLIAQKKQLHPYQVLILLRQSALLQDKQACNEKVLKDLEERIVDEFPEFMHQDLSVIIQSMTKLGYMPKRVIQQLDKQQKLTFFNVNESIRMAECVLTYCKETGL